MYKKIVYSILVSSLILANVNTPAYATGGRNDECLDATVKGVSGNNDGNASYEVNDDQVITGICIKAGHDMFDDGHSDLIGNGTYEGCYEVSGIGTSKVSVNRLEDGSSCKEVSHIDVYAEARVTEEPATEEPAVEEPMLRNLLLRNLLLRKPAVEEPATEEPAVEEPTVEEPTVEEPATEEPTVEEPAVEEPAVEKATSKDTKAVKAKKSETVETKDTVETEESRGRSNS